MSETTPPPAAARAPRLTEEHLTALEEALALATVAPWVAAKSMRDDCSVHVAIRTAGPLPEHPHSPRFVAWMTGLLRDYLPPSQRDRWRYCDKCARGYWEGRSVPIEVRDDPQIEADAALVVAARNALPALLAEVRAARAHASPTPPPPCSTCGDARYTRHLGRDNDEIVENCPDCTATSSSRAPATQPPDETHNPRSA